MEPGRRGEGLMTSAEAAAALGCSTRTLARLVAANRIRHAVRPERPTISRPVPRDLHLHDVGLLEGNSSHIPYVLALVIVVVGVDVLFFRQHARARLIANVGIVAVLAAFFLRVMRRS